MSKKKKGTRKEKKDKENKTVQLGDQWREEELITHIVQRSESERTIFLARPLDSDWPEGGWD